MIKLQYLTPEVYYKQSRDFQYIGRLYDTILNSIKTNIDMIYDIPSSDAAGSKMIDLLALTLGFKPKHNYSVNQLAAICSIFPSILRYKGTEEAINNVVQALLSVEGITETYSLVIDTEDPFKWNIVVPLDLTDINLLKDLLAYIVPAGISIGVVRASTKEISPATTKLASKDVIKFGAKNTEVSAQIAKAEEIFNSNIDTTSENPNGYIGTGDTLYENIIEVDPYVNGLTINSTIFDSIDDDSNSGSNSGE